MYVCVYVISLLNISYLSLRSGGYSNWDKKVVCIHDDNNENICSLSLPLPPHVLIAKYNLSSRIIPYRIGARAWSACELLDCVSVSVLWLRNCNYTSHKQQTIRQHWKWVFYASGSDSGSSQQTNRTLTQTQTQTHKLMIRWRQSQIWININYISCSKFCPVLFARKMKYSFPYFIFLLLRPAAMMLIFIRLGLHFY